MACFPKPAGHIRASRHQAGFCLCHSQGVLAVLVKVPVSLRCLVWSDKVLVERAPWKASNNSYQGEPAATCVLWEVVVLFLGHIVCYSMVYFNGSHLSFPNQSARDQTLPSSHICVDIELPYRMVAFSGQPWVHQTLNLCLYIFSRYNTEDLYIYTTKALYIYIYISQHFLFNFCIK